jgi:hypothetical protein
MAARPDGGVLVVGQTLAGDVLADTRGDRVRLWPVPLGLSHGRRVTAIDLDPQGRAYLATDGAGILTWENGDWSVHPLTRDLPVLTGSDLKPVDDIMVGSNGTLYAAVQYQVLTWR